MRQKTTTYYLGPGEPNYGSAEDLESAIEELKDLYKDLRKKLYEGLKSIGLDLEPYVEGVKTMIRDTMDVWKGNIQTIKDAFTQSSEPVGQTMIPAVQQAAHETADLGKSIGTAIGAAADKIKEITKAEAALKKTSASTAYAVKRSLAGFDQLNRLTRPAARSGGSSSTKTTKQTTNSIAAQFRELVNEIMKMVEPVRRIDFTYLMKGVERLTASLKGLASTVMQNLQPAWMKVMIPLGSWSVGMAGPESVNLLNRAIAVLCSTMERMHQMLGVVRGQMESVARCIGEMMLSGLNGLQIQFAQVTQALSENSRKIFETFATTGQQLPVLWSKLQPVLEQMRASWQKVETGILETVAMSKNALNDLISFIGGTLRAGWTFAWDGLTESFKGFGNGVLGGLNNLIRGIVAGINTIIRSLNQIDFTLPSWNVLGSLSGKRYRLNLQTIPTPQIPYLAQGAVLPANRPFLAMVGDQRHGTNVEAPLSTIQEAVAVVMDDMIESNLAGQERIVAKLQQLLDTVAGIRVGDEVIGRAARRYDRKMAVVKGGYV